jgi:hypothetical protein
VIDVTLTLRTAIALVGRSGARPATSTAADVRLERGAIFRPLPDTAGDDVDPSHAAPVALLGGYRRFI